MMTYPSPKFCSGTTDDEIHGYFDENKNRHCPKCAEKHIQERIKEAVSEALKKLLPKLLKRGPNERMFWRKEIITYLITKYVIGISNKEFFLIKKNSKEIAAFLNKVFKMMEDKGVVVKKMIVHPEIKRILKDSLDDDDFWCDNHLWTADVKSEKDVPIMLFLANRGEKIEV